MADKNIEMKRKKPDGSFDNYYPVTKAENVIDSDGKTVAAHLAEQAIHTAAGTANAITVTTGGNFGYAQGKRISFKAVANNTGNVTLNVDGKGAKPFLKPDGNQIPAGGVKNGKVFDAYYDIGSGGRFFLLARAEGNAVVADVLAGKTFSNDDDTGLIGTMPNRTGHVSGQSSSVSGTTLRIRPLAGFYPGDAGNSVQIADANFVPENIRKGIELLGLIGVLDPKLYATGTATSSATNTAFPAYSTGTINMASLTVAGLAFKPLIILAIRTASGTGNNQTVYLDPSIAPLITNSNGDRGEAAAWMLQSTSNHAFKNLNVYNGGFVLPVFSQSLLYTYVAWG